MARSTKLYTQIFLYTHSYMFRALYLDLPSVCIRTLQAHFALSVVHATSYAQSHTAIGRFVSFIHGYTMSYARACFGYIKARL